MKLIINQPIIVKDVPPKPRANFVRWSALAYFENAEGKRSGWIAEGSSRSYAIQHLLEPYVREGKQGPEVTIEGFTVEN